jgi:hypothetical protein
MSILTDSIELDLNAAFLNSDDWGETVTYTPSGGSAASVSAVWDDHFETIDSAKLDHNGMQIVTHQPAIFVSTSDITGTGEGDTVIRDSVTYYVTHIMGEKVKGMSVLLLSKRAIHGG